VDGGFGLVGGMTVGSAWAVGVGVGSIEGIVGRVRKAVEARKTESVIIVVVAMATMGFEYCLSIVAIGFCGLGHHLISFLGRLMFLSFLCYS